MGLAAQRAVAHGSRLKTLYDLGGGLHLFNGNALFRIIEFQQAAQECAVGGSVLHGIAELLIDLVAAGLCSLLQQLHGFGTEQMLVAVRLQPQIGLRAHKIKGLAVAVFHIALNILQGDAAHAAYGVGEIFFDHRLAYAHRLKNLAALIRLNGGNAHFGGDFHNAAQNGVVVIIHRRVKILVQLAVAHQFTHGFLCQIGIHCARAIAQQRGKMMHGAGLAAFQNQRHGRFFAGAHQMLGNRAHRQQAGNGQMKFIQLPVRQDQDIRAVAIGAVHLDKQMLQRLLQADARVISNRDHRHLKAGHLHAFDAQKIGFGQDRVLDLQHLAVIGFFLQQIAVAAHIHGGAGDHFFPQSIQRRVGDLCKHLFKIVEQRRVVHAQAGQRGVIAHGHRGLHACARHGQNARAHIGAVVAECLAQAVQLLGGIAFDLLVGDL